MGGVVDHKALFESMPVPRFLIEARPDGHYHDGDPVFMARNAWHLNDTQDKNPGIKFTATK